jgi:hypothetical protein
MVLFAPIRRLRPGLAASGALVIGLGLATPARGEEDRSRPLDLDVVTLEPGAPAPAPSAPAPSPEQDALARVAYLNQLWSEDGLSALPEIRSMYAAEVEFYGSRVSVEEVMADKLALAERWAERDYRLDLAASRATCASPTSCLVEGEVVWASRSPDGARRSGGRARVLMGLERVDGRFLIVREDGEVVERE